MADVFSANTEVRLKNDPSTVGLTTGNQHIVNGRTIVDVKVIGKGIKRYPSDQLEITQKLARQMILGQAIFSVRITQNNSYSDPVIR